MQQSQLVPQSPWCSIIFLVFYQRLFSLSIFFLFSLWSAKTAKSTIRPFLFFLLTINRSPCLSEIRRTFYILKTYKTLIVSSSRKDSGLCIYHLFMWSNFNFLHNSLWITFPTKSCLVFYSFCANLFHLYHRITYILGRYLSGFSPQLKLSHLLSNPLSSFSLFPR